MSLSPVPRFSAQARVSIRRAVAVALLFVLTLAALVLAPLQSASAGGAHGGGSHGSNQSSRSDGYRSHSGHGDSSRSKHDSKHDSKQNDSKKAESQKNDSKKSDSKKSDTKKSDTKKSDTKKTTTPKTPSKPAHPTTGNHDSKPVISLSTTNSCPDTSATVTITGLKGDVDYAVTVNGKSYDIVVTNGTAVFSVPHTDKSITVTVKYTVHGKTKTVSKCFTISPYECPTVAALADSCDTVGGSGDLNLTLNKLDERRTYRVNVSGSDAITVKSTKGTWKKSVALAPGTYTVSVTTDAASGLPSVPEVRFHVTIDPCPEPVQIALTEKCANSNADGSVNVQVSGFVPGREYNVSFHDRAEAPTAGTPITPTGTTEVITGLEPGEYTLTVVDVEAEPVSGQPLTWSKDVAVTSCTTTTPPPTTPPTTTPPTTPPTTTPPTTTPPTTPPGTPPTTPPDRGVLGDSVTAGDGEGELAHTGSDIVGPLALVVGLIGSGAGLLALRYIRRRQTT